MKTIRLYTAFITFLCLALTLPGFSQSMSNTDQVITLSNTCINFGVTNGYYNLELMYYDNDLTASRTITINGVYVDVTAGVMTITAPSGSFPSAAVNGWSLPDAWPGHIKLTSASVIAYMEFFINTDGVTLGFNCIALPVDYNSFTGYQSGTTVVLNWQTGMEQNSTYIEIYRYSGGSGGYYKIGQVPAAGNSSGPVNYTFTDAHPCASNSYYLKMLNSQGTLPISSGYLPVGCSGCTCTLPSPVYCNISINGPDYMCNQETPTAYTLSSPVPNYSNITWSIDQPSAVYLRTYGDIDRSKVTLLKRNVTAAVTLTATMSGCTNVITKYIGMGAPTPGINTDVECPNVLCWPVGDFGATSYNWTLYNYTYTGMSYGSGYEFDPYIGDGNDYQISLSYTNACGTSGTYQIGTFHCDPGTSTRTGGSTVAGTPGSLTPTSGSVVWPNPTNGLVAVTLPLATRPDGSTVQPKVYQVKVADAEGRIHKTYNYPAGIGTATVDISSLSGGVYILQIYDKQRWISKQVVLTK